jgi:hypothetical protein
LRQAYDYWQNQPENYHAGLGGGSPRKGAPANPPGTHRPGWPGRRKDSRKLWKGRPKTPGQPQRPPAHRRPVATIQLPPLKPSRTGPLTGRPCQESPSRAPGRLRHTALWWGVQTPRTRRRTAAPAGRLPPGVWVIKAGQRPTIHRLQQRRGPLGAPRLQSPPSCVEPPGAPPPNEGSRHGRMDRWEVVDSPRS